MTAPPPHPPVDQDTSSLVPGLLTVFAAYLTYRAAHEHLPSNKDEVTRVLQLEAAVGGAIAAVAARALKRQREAAGREGDEIWRAADIGLQVGVKAGLWTVADALIFIDRHGEPLTRDVSGEAPAHTSLVPTAANPPEDLARMTAVSTASAAQIATASTMGWHYKVWKTMQDNRVRETHRELEGQKRLIGQEFTSPSGARLQYPGDPTAPIGERIFCRCWLETARR